jgi:16S rRNA G966 N2-methylase RsmD
MSDFPYKKLYMKNPKFYFDNLKNNTYRLEPTRDNGWRMDSKDVYLNMKSTVYSECDIITDYFTEDARIKASTNYATSPLVAWNNKHYKMILKKKFPHDKNLTEKQNIEKLREAIFKTAQECTNFKVSLAVEIYKFFGAKIVFDPFGGWGDRMIGAAAAGVKSYTCTDPNTNLIIGYKNIERFIIKNTEMDVRFRIMPVEAYSIDQYMEDFKKTKSPDFIFSSPPFFNFEIYSKSFDQSTRYKTYESWTNKWFHPVIDRLWGILKPGGNLALYLPYVDGDIAKDLLTMMNRRGRRFRGIIACGYNNKRPIPLFVWNKRTNEEIMILPPAKCKSIGLAEHIISKHTMS